jgi:diguanylate cyclase (GGDEF)-like protein/PAS domain S-box-containing protein
MAESPDSNASDLHETVVENLFDGVYYVDRKRTITYWNPAAERISGYDAESVVGRHCFDDLLGHVDDTGKRLCRDGCPLVQSMAQRRGVEAEVFLHHSEGHRVPVHVRCQPVRDPDGKVVGAVEIFNEDGFYRNAISRIETLERASTTDELTGLPNRRSADLSLRSRLVDVQEAQWPLGLLFADIDFFKQFNDVHGHAVGDEVLRVVARSLTAGLRESDFAARWGGEEFVVVSAAANREQIETLAARLRNLVDASTVTAGGVELGVTLSIGATLASPADTIESLVERADAAMYASKADGRNRITFAEPPPSDVR